MKRLYAISLSIILGLLTLPFLAHAQFQDSFPALRYLDCSLKYGELQQIINAYQQGDAALEDYYAAKKAYVDCHNEMLLKAQEMLDEGVALHTSHQYEDAVSQYKKLLQLFVDRDERIEILIVQAYVGRWRQQYKQKEFLKVIGLIENARKYKTDDEGNFSLYYLESAARFGLHRREDAETVGLKAQELAQDATDEELIGRLLENLELRLDAPTNDTIGRQQYRISAMNIDKAREMINVPRNVVVAVIDAWIDANHPDMGGQLWENKDEIAWNNIDDDGNGYIDDRFGWNFIGHNGDMTPYGSHGTQVAGILWALPNNQIGIAWIVKKIELMPIIMCSFEDCYNAAYMDKAVRYAVDNGANIINLSLSSKDGEFLKQLTDTFVYAWEHGVVVVIAAGNGEDILWDQVGINTSLHPVSPVCNESFKEMIIGVGSVDKKWLPHVRANYGRCVDVYAYGEGVVSTALVGSEFGEYMIADGTSLAAPIVAGVIGLGYNKYGPTHPHIVYDALMASDGDNGIPHADEYLTQLGRRHLTSAEENALDLSILKIRSAFAIYPPSQKQSAVLRITQTLNTLEARFRKEKNWKNLARVYELQTVFEQLRY